MKRRSVYLTEDQDFTFMESLRRLEQKLGVKLTQQEFFLRVLKYTIQYRLDDFMDLTREEVEAEIQKLIEESKGGKPKKRKKK